MKEMSINRLLIMSGLHFVAMYLLMFSMVRAFDHIHIGVNQAYMAAIMTSPMLLLEGILMGSMYKNKKTLYSIMAGSVIAFILFFIFIRQQTAINDNEFLRSMIPHHSGAILMCEESNLTDPEIKILCGEIIESQQEEIDQMEEILLRM